MRAVRAGTAVSLLLAVLLALAPAAQAKETHLSLGAFGSSVQPSFVEPKGLALAGGDVYVIDGRSELQKITVSATAGKFKLKFGAATTGELNFNASAEQVRDALRTVVCGGELCLGVPQGTGNATGSNPYLVNFVGTFDSTDVPQIECVSGSPPLSGGSGCKVETTVPGVNGSITRYNADGTPSEFSALGSNAIDGRGAGDETPQVGLQLGRASEDQIAVDESGTATDGDIYVALSRRHLVDVFGPTGAYLGQLTEFKEGPTASGSLKALGEACGVGVDSTGALYLGDYDHGVHKYTQPGSPHNPLVNADNSANFASPANPCALAAGVGATASSLFVDRFSPSELFKLDATSGEVKYPFNAGPFNAGEITTVSVDPASGHLYAAKGHEVREYDASGPSEAKLISTITARSKVTGIALDGTTGPGGTLYVAREGSAQLETYGPLLTVPDVTTEAASGIGPTAATLNGTISAANGPSATCHFEYTTEAAYQANLKAAEEESKKEPKTEAEIAEAAFVGAQSAPCEPAGPFAGSGVNAVSAKATPLAHETKYRFRIVGENANGPSIAEHESTPATPCPPPRFEKTCPEILSFETFGKPQVKGGSASEITTAAAKISGEVNPAGQATAFAVQYVTEADFLKSGYNNATSVPEPAEGIGSGAAFLAVSQQLSGLEPATAYRFRIAATNVDGTTLGKEGTFATFAVPTGLPDERAYELVSSAFKLSEVFPPEPQARGLEGGCLFCLPGYQKEKMPMQASPGGDSFVYEGGPFSEGLASGANEYLAKRGAGGWQTTGLSEPRFGDGERQGYKAFSEGLSRGVLFQGTPVLSPQAPAEYPNLYRFEAGAPLVPLVTSTPPARSPGANTANKLRPVYAAANSGAASAPAFGHVVFNANDALTGAVPGTAPKAPAVGAEETDAYEWSEGQLHLVNVLPGNAAAVPDATIGDGLDFDHAISADGSRVFWSEKASGQVYVREEGTRTVKVPDPGRFLTATPNGSKVLLQDGILYDLEAETTADLTKGQGGFQGILGSSEDLARVYFVDTKALTPEEEENEAGEHAEAGKFNLYVADEGATRFIAVLAAGDNNTAGDNNIGGVLSAWGAAPGLRVAQASTDGRYLAFMSVAPLSGYDSRIVGGEGCGLHGASFKLCPEVFEYDAQTGSLSCASCNPSGQRPLGKSNLSLIFGNFEQPDNLPSEGEGRLFFESQDTLSLADANGAVRDVYEWQPEGVGGCALPKGCISLITDGHSPTDSQFINAGPSGEDAFFTTRSALVPQDIDGDFVDLYDARTGGGIAPTPFEPCLGEACKGPSTSPAEEPSGASSTFAGPGNEARRRCAPKKVLRRGRCVKRPRTHKHKRHRHRAAPHNSGGQK